jgi:hypothetical protein
LTLSQSRLKGDGGSATSRASLSTDIPAARPRTCSVCSAASRSLSSD